MHSLATLPPRQSHLLTRARLFKMISASIGRANAPAWKMGRCKQQPERSSVHLPPPLGGPMLDNGVKREPALLLASLQ